MATAWATIEDALRTWVKSATSYPDARVIWAEQAGSRPSGDIITLRLGDVVPLGVVDDVVQETDLNRTAGTEVELRAEGIREFGLTLQAYGSAVTGTSAARAALAKCQTALALPTIRDALETAGVTPFEIGPVQNVTALNHTLFEGRAVLEVRFYTRDSLSEYTGYIASVEWDFIDVDNPTFPWHFPLPL